MSKANEFLDLIKGPPEPAHTDRPRSSEHYDEYGTRTGSYTAHEPRERPQHTKPPKKPSK